MHLATLNTDTTDILNPQSRGLLFFGVRLIEDPDRMPVLQAQLQEKLPSMLDLIARYGGLYVSAVRSTAFVQPGQTLNEREDWEAEIIQFFERCRSQRITRWVGI